MAFAGFTYAVLAAVTWGLVYTVDQKVLQSLSPLAFLFLTYLLTPLLLLPFLLVGRELSLGNLSGISTRMWVLILLTTALGALANFFIFSSIKILGASTASIFEIAYPFFVILFSYFIFRAVPNLYFLLGALLIFAGAGLIITLGSR